MSAYETHRICCYLDHLVASSVRAGRPRPRGIVALWILDNAAGLGLRAPQFDRDDIRDDERRVDAAVVNGLAPFLLALRRKTAVAPTGRSKLERRLQRLADMFELDELDREILGLLVRRVTDPVLCDLVETVSNDILSSDELSLVLMQALLGEKRSRLAPRLAVGSPLRDLGLVSGEIDVKATRLVHRLAQQSDLRDRDLRRLVLGDTATSNLGLADFDFLGEAVRITHSLLAEAIETQRQGVNILFHGEPGTGKTEFAKVLGESLGCSVTFAGEGAIFDEEGELDEPDRTRRLSHLTLSRILGGRVGKAHCRGRRGRRCLHWSRRCRRRIAARVEGLRQPYRRAR